MSGTLTDDDTPAVGQTPALGDAPTLASADESTQPRRDAATVGMKLGRYHLLRTLGAGGMGVVYLAYDPELDRQVAIKVLHAHGSASSSGRARHKKEAAALAKLSHPNIVGVYDVGVEAGQLYFAMEFVAGQTIAQWSREPRPWREVVDRYLQAAQGLMAAHAAGIVHRDVKPDNILVGEDGRVRIADLGLAFPLETAETAETQAARKALAEDESEDLLTTRLTQTGVAVGTPGYMAPEQFDGSSIDSATDQFGLCAALYRSLYKRHAFGGGSVAAVCRSVMVGKIQPPPSDTDVPRRIHEAIVRGLSPRREDRFASMPLLVDALSWDPARQRRRVFASIGALALVVGAVWGPLSADAERPGPSCDEAPGDLEGVWDPATRGQVFDRLAAAGIDADGAVGKHLATRLDAYADALSSARVDACEATHVRGLQSNDQLEMRGACLDAAREQLRAVTLLLAAPEPTGAPYARVEVAVSSMPALDTVERCNDPIRVAAGWSAWVEDPASRSQMAEASALVAQGETFERAGRFEDALARADDAWSLADALDYDVGRARARLLKGRTLSRLNQGEDAAAALTDAIALADQAADPETRVRALTDLAWLLGETGEATDALRYARLGEGALRRLGSAPGLEAELLATRGVLEYRAGRHAVAAETLRRAIDLRREGVGEWDPDVATMRSNLGNLHTKMGDSQSAIDEQRAALAVLTNVYGAEHPRVAGVLNNLGTALQSAGRYAEALEVHERSLALRETLADSSASTDPSAVANALNGVGLALLGLDRVNEATAPFRRSLALRGDRGGLPEDRAEAAFGLARALASSEPEEAEQLGRRALLDYSATAGHEREQQAVQTWLGAQGPTQASRAKG